MMTLTQMMNDLDQLKKENAALLLPQNIIDAFKGCISVVNGYSHLMPVDFEAIHNEDELNKLKETIEKRKELDNQLQEHIKEIQNIKSEAKKTRKSMSEKGAQNQRIGKAISDEIRKEMSLKGSKKTWTQDQLDKYEAEFASRKKENGL